HSAPVSVPRPPSTAPASSAIDRLSVNEPGDTREVVTASMAPASPAQAALTMNASTRSAATFSPDSAAATGSSRIARQFRPTLLRPRFARITKVIRAASAHTHASQRVGGNVAPRLAGGTTVTLRPWSPPNTPGNLVASDGRATARARAGPAPEGAGTPAPAQT